MANQTDASWRLLVVTFNEGGERVPAERLRAAITEGLPAGALDGARAVFVARQEASPGDDEATVQWDMMLKSLGFPAIIGHSMTEERWTRATFYARDESEFTLVDSPWSGAKHGASGTVVSRAGRRLLLASLHLDGNAPPPKRLAPLQSVAVKASEGGLDAALAVGDINFALEPTPRAQASAGAAARAAKLLQGCYDDVMAATEEKLVRRLSPELEALLKETLATPAGRTELAALDGCPQSIDLPGAVLRRLQLQGLPSGSFPTYRLCNVDNKAFEGFEAAVAAAGARPSRPSEDSGLLTLDSTLTVSPECIHASYFKDSDKGHAGAIKRRADVCRLNLGWLDRLYLSTTPGAGCGGGGGGGLGGLALAAAPSEPLFVVGAGGKTCDHGLVKWLVEVSPLALGA